jgi:hypothetical protein
MSRTNIAPIVLVFFAASLGHASAQAVPVQQNGPSLDVTAKYVQDRLNEIRLSYSADNSLFDDADAENKCEEAAIRASGGDKPAPPCPNPVPALYTEGYSITGARADASSCSVAFRENVTGKLAMSVDVSFSLREINTISVTSMTDIMTQLLHDPVSGKAATVNYSPAVYGVRIKMNPGKKVHETFKGGSGEQDWTYVEFLDEDVANRFAKALNHAAELCGAVDNDPFK